MVSSLILVPKAELLIFAPANLLTINHQIFSALHSKYISNLFTSLHCPCDYAGLSHLHLSCEDLPWSPSRLSGSGLTEFQSIIFIATTSNHKDN